MVENQIGDRAKLDAEVERIRQRQQQEPRHVSISLRTAVSPAEIIEVEVTCHQCGQAFKGKALDQDGGVRLAPKLCLRCRAEFDAESARREADAVIQRRQAAWLDICPPLYRDTAPSKLQISGPIVEQVTSWAWQDKGVGLAGESGAGKTRLMFLLLRNLHFGGTRVVATTAKRFENWCHRMFDKDTKAREQMAEARRAKVLFIDDIGKEKYTERVESEFYDLIEYRTSRLLPILWTANASGEQLVRMMGEDRGVPIVRRLREFSTIISV